MAENPIRPAVVDAIERSLAEFGELHQSLAENSRQVLVVGEALMDLIPVVGEGISEMVGGGPCNSAKALARLGFSTTFIGGISSDSYGEVIEKELLDSGVILDLVHRSDLPTALAIATINDAGLASYEFKLDSTVSFNFHSSLLPKADADVIHIGSVATLLEPGASELYNWLSDKSAIVVFDPNVRPSIQGNKEIYRNSVERWIDLAKIVKLSEDDFSWLYQSTESDVIADWLSRGSEIVVVTRAEKGLSAFTRDERIDCPAAKVELVDSVGAGDTIGAVIVEGLLKYGLDVLKTDVLRQVLERAAKAAGITCSRAGANPPWKEELDLAL
jgi:fructokinase